MRPSQLPVGAKIKVKLYGDFERTEIGWTTHIHKMTFAPDFFDAIADDILISIPDLDTYEGCRWLTSGWYEFIKGPVATTHIAYVGEDMRIYLPENDVAIEDFFEAFLNKEAYRLVREDSLATKLYDVSSTHPDMEV